MRIDPARLYLWSGLVWHGAMRAYWVSLVLRITVELSLTDYQLVLLGTAMEAALLVSEVPTGVMADAVSRKWSVIVGFVAVGVAQLAAGLVEPFGLLVLTQVLWGIGYTFRSGAETAWVTDELGGAERVEGLVLRRARLQLVTSIFSILGGAALAFATSLSTSIVVSGLVLIVTGGVLAVTMRETAFQRPVAADTAGAAAVARLSAQLRSALVSFRSTLVAGARATGSSRSLRTLATVLILAGLASEAVDRLDIRRLDNLGLSTRWDEIAVVGAVAASEAALGALVLWWSRPRLSGSRVSSGMGAMLVLSAVGIAALGLVAVLPIAVFGLLFQGGLRSAAQPLAITWTNAHAPSSVRATVHSFVEQASSVGEIGGGVLLGAVAAGTTVPTALALSVVLTLVAGFVAFGGRRTWSEREVAPTG